MTLADGGHADGKDRTMKRTRVAALLAAAYVLAVVFFTAAYKPMQVAQDEASPSGSNRSGFFNGYAGLDTSIALPWLATDWGVKSTAACSVAVSQSPELVSYTANFGFSDSRRAVAASIDTFLAGHPNAGESRIDSTYFPVVADEQYSLDLKVSLLKVKVATGTPTIRYWATSNRAF